jgi:hypothetical protein
MAWTTTERPCDESKGKGREISAVLEALAFIETERRR